MKRFMEWGCPGSGVGIFQGLEICGAMASSLWNFFVRAAAVVALCAACGARGQEAVSPLEVLRQSRAAVAATNMEFALALAQAAVAADPAFVEGWKQQGRIEMLMGKAGAAYASFTTVLTLRPEDPDVPVWKMWLMLDMGYARDVASQLAAKSDAELIKLGDSLVARAAGALLTRDFNDDAAKLAGRWVKIATNEDSLVAASALVMLATGDTAGAVSALEKIKTGSAKELSANAWLRIGRVRTKNGDAAGAKTAFEKALEIWPGWSSAVKELAGPVAPPTTLPK
jgi:tetratricopeptide (TPR) repeat protein